MMDLANLCMSCGEKPKVRGDDCCADCVEAFDSPRPGAREIDHFVARPSESHRGMWTIMQLPRGTLNRKVLLCWPRDHRAARMILKGIAALVDPDGNQLATCDFSLLDAACRLCGTIGGHRARCAHAPAKVKGSATPADASPVETPF